ncbi:MAG: efflux RND transporter periplasmic adaptor subunit [Pseudomonadota bacterium]
MSRLACLRYALGLLALSQAAMAQQGPAGVLTDFVETRLVAETIPVFAEVVSTSESEVAVRIDGPVVEVPSRTGDRVEEGDPLAVLDRELLEILLRQAEAAVTEAEAGLAVAEAGVTQAERAFARVDGLQDTSAFSQGQFEDRESELARARGQLAEAEARRLNADAARARAAYDLARAVVEAPFDGILLDVMIDPGEYVQAGTPVARLLDTDDLEIEANVPAQFVGSLDVGQILEAAYGDGTPLELTVRALLPTESATTRTRPVRFTADLAGTHMKAAVGQTVTVQVPRARAREVVLVPKDAVVQARGAWQAFVHSQGTAEPRTVEIGASFGPYFEVIDGLAPGDEVVVRGNERLRPMQEIAPTPVEHGDASGTSSQGAPGSDSNVPRPAQVAETAQ